MTSPSGSSDPRNPSFPSPQHFMDLIDRLRAVWEAQPSLSLPQVWAQLAGLGVSVSSSDAELSHSLTTLESLHPAAASASAFAVAAHAAPNQSASAVLIETLDPARRVTLTHDGFAIVRTTGLQPVVWQVGRVMSSRAGTELVVEDAEGFLHSLGTVVRLTVLNRRWELFEGAGAELLGAHGVPEQGLTGLPRTGLGQAVYVALAGSGDVVVVDSAIQVVTAGRRDAQVEVLRDWERVVSCMQGDVVRVRRSGGEVVQLGQGIIKALWRVE